MGAWLSKVLHVLGTEATEPQRVREALERAHRARVKLAIEAESAQHIMVMTSSIEQVREEDFVISQPTIGGLTQQLAFGENVKIGFVQQAQYHTGESKCLGRIKIPAGVTSTAGATGDSMLYAYRLSIPGELRVENRRSSPRTQLGFAQTVQAQLYAPGVLDGPLFGEVADISMTGARIVTQLPSRRILPAQMVYLKAMLPEPVGLIDELVVVARVDFDPRTRQCTVGVRFQRRIEGLEVLMRGENNKVAV